MMRRWLGMWLVSAIGLCVSTTAAAQDDLSWESGDDGGEGAEESGDEASAPDELMQEQDGAAEGDASKFPILLTGGLKFGGGGNYLSTPTNRPLTPQPFDDGAGGWGAAIGPYVQGTILDGLLSLETGFIFDWGYNWSKFTLNNTDYEFGFEFSTLRIPLMLELGTPGEGTRLSVGTGPEFAIGRGSKGRVDPGVPPTQYTSFPAHGEGGTLWAFNVGAEVPFKMLRITFDIHYTMNLDSQSDYAKRVGLSPGGGLTPDVLAKHDMDLRLLLGVGYDYTIGL